MDAAGALTLLRTLQLASPALPVGSYSYSQGLEQAVEAGAVRDEASARRWIEDALELSLFVCEAPCLAMSTDAACRRDTALLAALNAEFLATRETAELRAETLQLGHSLVRLLEQLPCDADLLGMLHALPEPTFPCAWGCAAAGFGIPREQAAAAYLWAWLENQVLGAIKLVPLGQSAGQRILLALGATIAALSLDEKFGPERWINYAPGLALASTAHETQYTRLFRS